MMMQLRMDVEDLKRGFDEFRERHSPIDDPITLPYPFAPPAGPGRELYGRLHDEPVDTADDLDEETTVVYRPGMTMREVEREAIIAALKEVGGNRREAADLLGIGERTLYRKIKEYEIPL
jgi:DNA-binding NtrC family response regulator